MPLQFGKPVFAKPIGGQRVRKEGGELLPEDGSTVIHSSYYLRRKKEGVLTLSELPGETKVAQAEKKSGKSAVS